MDEYKPLAIPLPQFNCSELGLIRDLLNRHRTELWEEYRKTLPKKMTKVELAKAQVVFIKMRTTCLPPENESQNRIARCNGAVRKVTLFEKSLISGVEALHDMPLENFDFEMVSDEEDTYD